MCLGPASAGWTGNAVRIMTVHGSKGLQAPIVFLPDTVHQKAKAESILWPHKSRHTVPYYIMQKDSAPSRVRDAQAEIDRKADEEYRRLLYVAMTRAEERLYVGGYTGKRQANGTHWYEDVRAAFGRLDRIERLPSGVPDEHGEDMPIFRLSAPRTMDPDKTGRAVPARKTGQQAILPEWTAQAAPAEPDYVEELGKLARLRDQGVITDEDFEAKKKQILGI